MNELIIAHNLGLGDHFICNGLINYFSLFYEKIFLPVYNLPNNSNIETVKSLYKDNTKVSLLPINHEVSIWHDPDILYKYTEHLCLQTIDVELFKYKPSTIAWYRYFYEQFGIPYYYRYKYFCLPKTIEESEKLYHRHIPDGQKYRVIHDNSSVSGYYPLMINKNDSLLTIKIDRSLTDNLLNWVDILKNADEIHVVDSSVFCLVDSIKKECRGDLYFHDIRWSGSPQYHEDLISWNIIKYPIKI